MEGPVEADLSARSANHTGQPGRALGRLEEGLPGLLHPEVPELSGSSETSRERDGPPGWVGSWVETHLPLLDHVADHLPGTRLQALVG